MTIWFRAIFTAALMFAALPSGARGACPGIPCDCVGAAAGYRAVALEDLSDFDSVVYGDLCAETARLREPPGEGGGIDDIEGSLHVLAATGVAVSARISRPDPGDNVFVAGVLATGGGSVTGPVVAGTLDTSGSHPGITSCQQATVDVQTTSQMLAGLTATQVLPHIIADGPGTTQFAVGPGVNVVQVDGRIAVRDNVLEIVLDPATDAVVFNARALSMRRGTRIVVTGGDDSKVMINLPGPGPAAVVKRDAWVAPVVFAPERVIRATGGARFAGMFGRRVKLREVFLDQIFDTCASPSGAFLEAPAAF